MDDETVCLIASNLTIAFYSGSIAREPYFGEEKRSTFYSPTATNRIPSVSPTEVSRVYGSFCEMIGSLS